MLRRIEQLLMQLRPAFAVHEPDGEHRPVGGVWLLGRRVRQSIPDFQRPARWRQGYDHVTGCMDQVHRDIVDCGGTRADGTGDAVLAVVVSELSPAVIQYEMRIEFQQRPAGHVELLYLRQPAEFPDAIITKILQRGRNLLQFTFSGGAQHEPDGLQEEDEVLPGSSDEPGGVGYFARRQA